jgi:hypothetical protein
LYEDWIAHDILDSIVDSFFPFLQEIEKEVTAIDNMVYYLGDFESVSAVHPVSTIGPNKPPAHQSIMLPFETELKSDSLQSSIMGKRSQEEKEQQGDDKEAKDGAMGLQKYYTSAEKLREAYRPRFVSPRLSPRLLYRRLKRHVGNGWRALWWAKAESLPSARQTTLRRMARTRKLVTVLGRLLATKSDVVTQIRKRLAKAGAGVHGSEELEVAVYMGDVQGASSFGLAPFVMWCWRRRRVGLLLYRVSDTFISVCRSYSNTAERAGALRANAESITPHVSRTTAFGIRESKRRDGQELAAALHRQYLRPLHTALNRYVLLSCFLPTSD